jgi:hypothetical protein
MFRKKKGITTGSRGGSGKSLNKNKRNEMNRI